MVKCYVLCVVLKRKKGASNEPGATWACDTVWTASASRSLGKRMFTLSVITCVVFMGGGLKSSSLYGSTSSGLCGWCCFRPTLLVMTRSAEGGCETSWGVDPLRLQFWTEHVSLRFSTSYGSQHHLRSARRLSPVPSASTCSVPADGVACVFKSQRIVLGPTDCVGT